MNMNGRKKGPFWSIGLKLCKIFTLSTIERHLKVEGPTMRLVGTWNEPNLIGGPKHNGLEYIGLCDCKGQNVSNSKQCLEYQRAM